MPDNLRVDEHKVAVIGGDLRLLYLAILLRKQGYPVTIYGNDKAFYSLSKPDFEYISKHIHTTESFSSAMKENDIIIAPIPLSKDGNHIMTNPLFEAISISNFLGLMTHKPFVFAGAISQAVTSFFEEHEIPYCDLMKLETVAINNAIATAEGTIAEAIKRSQGNLHQSKGLILGFGRCARILASKLKGFDMEVTIAARKAEARAYANAYGFHSLPITNALNQLFSYDYIFNTIPSRILDRNSLQTAKPDVTIIDIASAPGGVDLVCAHEMNLNASLCLALPGIYAPMASARILFDAILDALVNEANYTRSTE